MTDVKHCAADVRRDQAVEDCARPCSSGLCEFHYRRLVGHLGRLQWLYLDLSMAVEPTSSRGSERGPSETPLPIRSDVLDLMADIAELAESWEDAHRKHAGYYRRDQTGRQGHRLQAACDYVRRHLDGIVAMDANIATEVAKLVHRAEGLLGRLGDFDRVPMPCPDCDRTGGLRRYHGSDDVQCHWCGAWWDRDAHRLLVRITLNEAQHTDR